MVVDSVETTRVFSTACELANVLPNDAIKEGDYSLSIGLCRCISNATSSASESDSSGRSVTYDDKNSSSVNISEFRGKIPVISKLLVMFRGVIAIG